MVGISTDCLPFIPGNWLVHGLEIFRSGKPKQCYHFYIFQPKFPECSVNGKQPIMSLANLHKPEQFMNGITQSRCSASTCQYCKPVKSVMHQEGTLVTYKLLRKPQGQSAHENTMIPIKESTYNP